MFPFPVYSEGSGRTSPLATGPCPQPAFAIGRRRRCPSMVRPRNCCRSPARFPRPHPSTARLPDSPPARAADRGCTCAPAAALRNRTSDRRQASADARALPAHAAAPRGSSRRHPIQRFTASSLRMRVFGSMRPSTVRNPLARGRKLQIRKGVWRRSRSHVSRYSIFHVHFSHLRSALEGRLQTFAAGVGNVTKFLRQKLSSQIVDDLGVVNNKPHRRPLILLSNNVDSECNLPIRITGEQGLQRLNDMRLQQTQILDFKLLKIQTQVFVHQPIIAFSNGVLASPEAVKRFRNAIMEYFPLARSPRLIVEPHVTSSSLNRRRRHHHEAVGASEYASYSG